MRILYWKKKRKKSRCEYNFNLEIFIYEPKGTTDLNVFLIPNNIVLHSSSVVNVVAHWESNMYTTQWLLFIYYY